MSRRGGATTGFTLTELLVVMGIAAVLLAITIPVAKTINQGNRVARCNAQLQQIGQALKMYHLDYQTVPACYLGDADGDTAIDNPALPSTVPVGPGLEALWRTDYLHTRKTLHCPSDIFHTDGSHPTFFQSYTGRDEVAQTDAAELYGLFNQYKYLSYRGITHDDYVAGDDDYYRQLGVIIGWDGTTPIFDTSWHPDDSTVVTWCDWHADSVIRQGEGQYLVLFWDGSVRSMPESLLCTDAVRDAAWRVRPTDQLP